MDSFIDILKAIFFVLPLWQTAVVAIVIIFITLLINWKSKDTKLNKVFKSITLGIYITIIVLVLNFYVFLVNGLGFLERIFDIFRPYSYMVGIVEDGGIFGIVYREIIDINSDGSYVYAGMYSIPEIENSKGKFVKVVLGKRASIRESAPATISKIKSTEIISEEELKKELEELNED